MAFNEPLEPTKKFSFSSGESAETGQKQKAFYSHTKQKASDVLVQNKTVFSPICMTF